MCLLARMLSRTEPSSVAGLLLLPHNDATMRRMAMTILGDRRSQVRFVTTRDTWACINLASQLAVIRDIGPRGALIEMVLPTSGTAVRVVDVSLGADVPVLTGIVRHMRLATGQNRYLMGLEFVRLSPPATVVLERIVTTGGGAAGERPPANRHS